MDWIFFPIMPLFNVKQKKQSSTTPTYLAMLGRLKVGARDRTAGDGNIRSTSDLLPLWDLEGASGNRGEMGSWCGVVTSSSCRLTGRLGRGAGAIEPRSKFGNPCTCACAFTTLMSTPPSLPHLRKRSA